MVDDKQDNITELCGKEAEDFILAVEEVINGCRDGTIEGEYFEF